MQRILIIGCFLMLAFTALSQKSTVVKGVVYDTLSKKGLAFSTVSLVNAKDSVLVNFTKADSLGRFQLKQVTKGKYLLSTSYVGFLPVWKAITVNDEAEINLGNIALTDVHTSNVTVTAKRPPVVINGDTLEFNSENFKTQPNAVVEDLLKKLPGVAVDADGTVRVNGQRVSRVFVNGKDFFNGDPKMATKNLDADAIDKVQVFDKKSDRSEFTGIDDGNSQKAINLKLKKDRNNAVFGKVAAGAGEDKRFDAQSNINKFKGEEQMSFLGMGNNTNKQGFSIGDVLNFTGELSRGMRTGGGGITIRTGGGDDNNGLPVTGLGQNQQGIAQTFAGGLNYNNTWKKKTDFNASGVLSDINLQTDRSINRQFLFPGNNYNYASESSSNRIIRQQRVNMTIDHKIDSFSSLRITPVLSFQQQNSKSYSSYASETVGKTLMNDGYNNTTTRSNGYNFTNDILFRKKFRKRGRTISATLNLVMNNSNQDGTLNTKNTFYNAGFPPKDSLINQVNSNNALTRGIGGNIAYTEPVGKRSLIEVTGFYNSSIGESNRKTYDFNSNSGKHDVLNSNLSNHFKSDYAYTGTSINFRSNQKKFNYGFGTSLQFAQLKSINQTTATTIRQQFTDLLPSANIQYRFNSFRNLSLNYATSTQQPSTSQLQPFQNIADPLNIVEGNPDLLRSYQHSLSVNYFASDPATRKNFFGFLSLVVTQNAIVYADSIFATGVRKSKPININGNKFLFGNINYGFPIKKLKTRIDFTLGANYSRNISLVNGQQNDIDNIAINPGISISYAKDNVIDVHATIGLRINQTQYSLQPQLNTNFLTQQYGIEMTNYLPMGLVMNNNFNYSINTGRADGFNISMPLWNASLAKSFLKNKRAEIKMSVQDLLNRNTGLNRTANQNFIEDSRFNVLRRYFLATFTFRLHKSAGNGGPNVVIKTFGN